MRIKVLRNTGANLPNFTEGQVADVSDDVAELLCGLRIAEILHAIPDEPVRAVPDSPGIQAYGTVEHATEKLKAKGKQLKKHNQ